MTRLRSAHPILAAIGVLAVPTLLMAHHGWSGYDSGKTLKLTGTITESSYGNPHGSATIKTPDKTWTVVLAPPGRMETRGLTREMLATGATVTVEGYQNLTDAKELRAERIVVGSKTIELR
jgi:hypothetical protein